MLFEDDDEIPHVLGMAVQRARLVEQGGVGIRVGGRGLQGGDGIDQGIFGGELGGMHRILDHADTRQDHVHIRMTLPAGTLGIQQRAQDVVAGIFHGAVPNVGHVAVRAGDAGLEMRAVGREQLVIRMAGLHDGRAGAGIGPIREGHGILVLDDVLDAHAVRPGDGQQLFIAGKVIGHMAVGAHQRAHLLAGIGVPVDALGFEGRFHRRVGDDQAHRPGFVAVGAADRVVDLGRHVREQLGVVGFHAHL